MRPHGIRPVTAAARPDVPKGYKMSQLARVSKILLGARKEVVPRGSKRGFNSRIGGSGSGIGL